MTARRRAPWTYAVRLGLLALGLCSFAAALSSLGWPFELFVHFRWQLGGALLLLALLAAGLRDLRALLLVTATAALQVLAATATSSHDAGRTPATCAAATAAVEPALRVITLNLQFSNREHARALGWLERHPADVVVLQEVTSRWRERFARLRSLYPYQVLRTREDAYGIGVLSRHPLASVRPLDLAKDGLPSLAIRLEADDGAVELYALHAHWPIVPRLQRARDMALARAAVMARSSTLPTVLAGDLNLTPYAPAFSRLLRDAHLDDALGSRRWRPTWHASAWPLALPIDHVLVSRQLCVAMTQIGPDVGSDHRPVLVELRLKDRR